MDELVDETSDEPLLRSLRSGVAGDRTKYSCDIDDDGMGLDGRNDDNDDDSGDDGDDEVDEGEVGAGMDAPSPKGSASATDTIRLGPLRGAVVM